MYCVCFLHFRILDDVGYHTVLRYLLVMLFSYLINNNNNINKKREKELEKWKRISQLSILKHENRKLAGCCRGICKIYNVKTK